MDKKTNMSETIRPIKDMKSNPNTKIRKAGEKKSNNKKGTENYQFNHCFNCYREGTIVFSVNFKKKDHGTLIMWG